MLILEADELQGAAAGLLAKLLLLADGIVDVLDVAVVGGDTEGDEVIGVREHLLEGGDDLVQGGGILHHGGGNAVDLLGAVPLLLVEGLDQGIHEHLAVCVGDGDRDDLIVIVHARQLQVEEQNALTLHAEGLGAVSVALGTADGQILFKAGAAHLALVANVLPANRTLQGTADGGALIVEVDHGAVGAEVVGHGLLHHVVVHLIQPLAGVKAHGGGALGGELFHLGTAVQLDDVHRLMLVHHGAVPQLGGGLGDAGGVVVEGQVIPLARAGGGISHGGEVHHVQHLFGEVGAAVGLLGGHLRDGDTRGEFHGFHWFAFLSYVQFYIRAVSVPRRGTVSRPYTATRRQVNREE